MTAAVLVAMSAGDDRLALAWGALLLVLLTGYAILDGFDLGVGLLHRFVPSTDHERRVVMNSIGPLWDGNEVWLVTFGGALFAAFPEAYATAFSAFYTPFMLLLFSLILRAVSLEFRGKVASPRWRRLWDEAFFVGSGSAAYLFGLAVGNVVVGIPLDERGDFTGDLSDLVTPYPLAMGLLAVTAFAMHGACFLALKTEGDLRARVDTWIGRSHALFAVTLAAVTALTVSMVPSATANFERWPWLWILPAALVATMIRIPLLRAAGRFAAVFTHSCVVVAALVGLFAAAVFPHLVVSSPNPEQSLTLFNAASSPDTLKRMLWIAAIGAPFVAGYTVVIYWTYRGVVRLDDHSY